MQHKGEYWNEYYQKHQRLDCLDRLPSQFSVFFLSYIRQLNIDSVIEIGCGNGRDTRLFVNYVNNVKAFDLSPSAVSMTFAYCQGKQGFQCFVADITNANIHFDRGEEPLAIYARFLLHTFTDDEVRLFFDKCSANMSVGDHLFLEYRNDQDQHGERVTQEHFRNYLDSDWVASVANDVGLNLIYQVEGRGMAKYLTDDAIVTRQVFAPYK